MALDPITAALDVGKTIVDKIWPDAGESERNKINMILTQFSAQANIILAEAKSDGFLTKNWRPLTMLVFVGLIVARWFGWSAENLTPAEYLELWSIVKIGLGGYVVGRSVEKTIGPIAKVVNAIKGGDSPFPK